MKFEDSVVENKKLDLNKDNEKNEDLIEIENSRPPEDLEDESIPNSVISADGGSI